MGISELVQNWGGFEQLVAELHETGEVSIERNVTLKGRSGASRQIDVLIRHKQGLYEHLVVAECKYWNSPVERSDVDVVIMTVREIGASCGVIFSTKGFQSGAVLQAKHDGIELYRVRDLTTEERGLPGRIVDMFLQVIQPSIGNISIEGAFKIGDPFVNTPITLPLAAGPEGFTSSTPTLKRDGSPGGDPLEQYLADAMQQALAKTLAEVQMINGSTAATNVLATSACPLTCSWTYRSESRLTANY
jgi:Restriction endonuclease